MKNTIGLVGVGSLGGYIAKKLQDHVDTICAVDPDIVEEKNLRNSIYTRSDICKPKVIALKDKISECEFVPIKADIKLVDLPPVHSMIDCRDVINRNIRTDVKFLIVGKNLRVDCEDPVIEDDQPGKYLIDLDKPKVEKAATLAAKTFLSNRIKDLKTQKSSINLPLSTNSVDSEMEFLIKQKETPLVKRDISPHIFEEIKGISDKRDFVKTRLCKLGDNLNIVSFEPKKMHYMQVIEMLNDVVLRDGGTYFIDTQTGFIEICNPLFEGGA